MLEISNLALPLDAGLDDAHAEKLVRRAAARALNVAPRDIVAIRLLKRSVDARKKNDVHFVATLGVELAGGAPARADALAAAAGRKGSVHVKAHKPYEPLQVPQASDAPRAAAEPRPVVVGTGPAGLFCALYLARAGLRPLVLERGAAVEQRLEAVDAFNAGSDLDPHSNIQFGEGGAGTFSDGKLTTNIKSPWSQHVLHLFVEAGAPEEILWQAKPHIGTDLLVDVVRTMREQIKAAGGEVRFETQLTGLRFEHGQLTGIEAANLATGAAEQFPARRVVLACGHSARDTFELVRDAGVFMEQKPFSVGVRIEHPQQLINRAQYGKAADHPALGAADYKLSVHLRPKAAPTPSNRAVDPDASDALVQGGLSAADKRQHKVAPSKNAKRESTAAASQPASQVRAECQGRGVYTFCMCPGGEVVCAASEPGGVVVNGMSRFARDGRNANSALLVGVGPEDFESNDPLAGVELQRKMEQAAYEAVIAAGGKPYQAPAQTVGDFLANRAGNPSGRVRPTYARGVAWCNLRDCLPPFAADAMREALPLLDRRLHGFADPRAVMTGVETRSSSPVRIVRGKNLQAQLVADGAALATQNAPSAEEAPEPQTGLYPCGEGAGYAGGIMSAACDGLRVAAALVAQLTETDDEL